MKPFYCRLLTFETNNADYICFPHFLVLTDWDSKLGAQQDTFLISCQLSILLQYLESSILRLCRSQPCSLRYLKLIPAPAQKSTG